jgi:hypothetical protein
MSKHSHLPGYSFELFDAFERVEAGPTDVTRPDRLPESLSP